MIPFSETILEWYAANGRDLPWRHTRDPYAIWLSEIILQQTRIAQGQAYWERFMAAFPNVKALASASEDEVLRLWQGLGYYSRARNLHAAARQIVELGAFPDTIEGIRRLKGVGDYTAAAIGSIAFGLPAAVVDGNVYRVLARHFGIVTPVGSTAAKKEFSELARKLLPTDRPGDFNQGMMDFGAVQCTPVSPACLLCPLADSCTALATGQVDRLPVKEKGTAVQTRRFDYIYLRFRGRTAIRRRGPGDIWQGLYEPVVREPGPRDGAGEKDLLLLRAGVKHQLTHRTLLADFYLWTPQEEPDLPEGYVWIEEAELDRYAKPRLFELLLESLPG
ncbi:MAG: A/G-specific adenine glycosylase [Bacteroidales bacterium]|nr:A/G-specific adenine glycosylase [Bacteroidales bacterium]